MFVFVWRPFLVAMCLLAPTEALTCEQPVASETIATVRMYGPYARKDDADCKADEMRMRGWYTTVYRRNGYWWVKASR